MFAGADMTPCDTHPSNAVTPRFDPEPFRDMAHQELAAHPLVRPGVCQNPTCSAHFSPRRSWQKYCSDRCKAADVAEMRRIGHLAAPALLAWRMGKYETQNEDLRALSRAGRNYVSALQSGWFKDRRTRASNVSSSEPPGSRHR